jgi:hypothetical protein
MFIFNQLSSDSAAMWLAGLETAPQVIASSKYIDPGTPPTPLFCMFVTLEDAIAYPPIVPSRNSICVQ